MAKKRKTPAALVGTPKEGWPKRKPHLEKTGEREEIGSKVFVKRPKEREMGKK